MAELCYILALGLGWSVGTLQPSSPSHQLDKPEFKSAQHSFVTNADILGSLICRPKANTFSKQLKPFAFSFRVQSLMEGERGILNYSAISEADDASSSSRTREICSFEGLEWHQVVVVGFFLFLPFEASRKNTRKVVQIGAILKEWKYARICILYIHMYIHMYVHTKLKHSQDQHVVTDQPDLYYWKKSFLK